MNKKEKLANKPCQACSPDQQPVSGEQLARYQDSLKHWEVITVDNSKRLTRVFQFKNFVQALAFTNQVGALAEIENHHPAILTEWGKVRVTWWTHSMDGLHDNDFILAARTDMLMEKSYDVG